MKTDEKTDDVHKLVSTYCCLEFVQMSHELSGMTVRSGHDADSMCRAATKHWKRGSKEGKKQQEASFQTI